MGGHQAAENDAPTPQCQERLTDSAQAGFL